jgi:RES domain-containing protein
MYRFAAPRWATEDHLLTGAGALAAGGRWHPIGAFPAVYLSLTPETALAESLAHYRRFGLAIYDAMPKTLNAVVAHFHRVLGLTKGEIRRHLGLSLERIREEPWWEREASDQEALTQAAGRVARAVGLEGLIVPSAAHKNGAGIVYFPGCLLPATTLQIINPSELPSSFS